MRFKTSYLFFGLVCSAPAAAADREACAKGMVCANTPQTIISALQEAGYKAKLDKNDDGDPMVSSAAGGYNYEIYFSGCELAEACDSLQFLVSFTAEPRMTPVMANDWNSDKRFSQAAILKNGKLGVYYDVTTRGGLNAKNFADVLDRWSTVMGALDPFFDKHPQPAVAAPAK